MNGHYFLVTWHKITFPRSSLASYVQHKDAYLSAATQEIPKFYLQFNSELSLFESRVSLLLVNNLVLILLLKKGGDYIAANCTALF